MDQHSEGKHSVAPNSGAFWDYLHGSSSGPCLSLSFEGDPLSWEQLKERAMETGVTPRELIRLALLEFLERPSIGAAARARFMAHREWERTRPVLVGDRGGMRYVSADRLFVDYPDKG